MNKSLVKKGQTIVFSDNKRGLVKSINNDSITVVPDYESKTWESATIPLDMVQHKSVIVADFPAETQDAKNPVFPRYSE